MPVASQTIRLFVSSTFSDLKAERDALQREVFPRLKRLCLARGFRFQAIDLRWGISEEAGRDNKTLRICLRELRRCQQDRPKPNFLILLGDRYGWRPLPEIIPAALFQRLQTRIAGASADIAPLLNAWYRRDDNAVPPIYELQPRGAAENWRERVETPLLGAMEEAARALALDPGQDGVSIGASATEQEIIQGAFNVPDAPAHVRAFFRTIKGAPDPAPLQCAETRRAAEGLRKLKARIHDHIGAANICGYSVPYRDGGVQAGDLEEFCAQAWKRLSEVVEQQLDAIAAIPAHELEEQAHQDFGKERCHRFVGRSETLARIAGCLRHGTGGLLALAGPPGSGKSALMARAAEEVQRPGFEGGNPQVIARHIGATPASTDLIQLLRNLVAAIRLRYPLEAAAEQPSSEPANHPPGDAPIPLDYEPLVMAFHQVLQRPTAGRPLFLFLDALDQLAASDQSRLLSWLPASPSPHARLIVSAALPAEAQAGLRARPSDPIAEGAPPPQAAAAARDTAAAPFSPDPRQAVMAALASRTDAQSLVTLGRLTPRDGERMLANWLAEARRTLQPAQQAAVLEGFQAEASPLWLRTAAQEASRLASWQPAPNYPPATQRLLGQVLDRLSREEEHGPTLVARALGCLACARHGLAEDEILGILSADPEVMEDFRRRSPNSPKVDSLPIAVWVRLHGDLAFHLAERQAQGTRLTSFYHRSFLEAVSARSLASSTARQTQHQRLADWFGAQDWFIAPALEASGPPRNAFADPASARKASELPWHLLGAARLAESRRENSGDWDALTAVLCDIEFVEAKCRAGLVLELQEDYHAALAALPDSQKELQATLERQARADRWTREIIDHARRWNAGGDKPALCDIIPSVTPWRPEAIQAEIRRRIASPTRLDRLKAFARFVRHEGFALSEFGARPGFALQQAFNQMPSGAVHCAAARLGGVQETPMLLRRWLPGAVPNPMPALERTLQGHQAGVTCVSLTPDGLRALSASHDQTTRVWDLVSGQCLRILEGHHDRINAVSLAADGRRAVSASDDNTLRVWRLDTGQCLRTLEGHRDSVKCASLTPDGSRALSGGWDCALRLWDLDTGQCLRQMPGHTDWIRSASLTPDGRIGVSGSQDGTIRVWNLVDGKCLRAFDSLSPGVECVEISPDAGLIVSGSSDGVLRLWTLESGICRLRLPGHTGPVRSVSLTADGRRALSAGEDHALRLWDLETGQCLRILEGHTAPVWSVQTTPDGRRALSGGADATLRLWDLETGHCPPAGAAIGASNWSLSATPDGRRAVSGSVDHRVRLWDLASGECVRTLEGHQDLVRSVSVASNGRQAVSGSDDRTARVWDLETGQCLRVLQGHTAWVMSVKITPDTRRVVSGASGMDDNTVGVWDLETGQCLRLLAGHASGVRSVCVTPDSLLAVSGSADHSIRVWDLNSGQCLRTLSGHSAPVTSVSATGDGRRVVSGSEDRTLRVWDLASGRCLRALEGHTRGIRCVDLAPDHRHALSAGSDKTLRLWDLETGRCLAVYCAPAEILSAVFTDHGRAICAGTGGPELLLLDAKRLSPGPGPNARSEPLQDPNPAR